MNALFVALILSAVDPLSAKTKLSDQTVRSITVQGNKRTQDATILDEIDTRPGQRFVRAKWAADVQRVRDLGLFWTTKTTAETTPDGLKLYLTVEDKWTLIPLFGFDRTEGVTEWSGGLSEANFLGRNMQLSFKFARKYDGNTYSIANGSNRIRATPYNYYVEAREALSRHRVYDQKSGKDEVVRGYYQYRRTSLYLQFGRRLDRDGHRRINLFYYVRSNRYSLWEDEPEQIEANRRFRFRPPEYRFTHRIGITASIGKIHYDDYIYTGSEAGIYLLNSIQTVGSPAQFGRVTADWTWMVEPFRRHNAGVRLMAGLSGSDRVEDSFVIGGLGEVRGFPDERFLGDRLWLANAEYRYPALDNRYVLGQIAAFVDAGKAWSEGEPWNEIAAGGGVGLRVVVKPIVTMMVRFDYAHTVSPYAREGYSLGISQFF